MKFILFVPLLIIFSSCKNDIEIIKSEKQTVIQGFQNAKPFINYHLEIQLKKDLFIDIDSVKVINNKKCIIVKNYSINNPKTGKYYEKISKKGIYAIDISLKDKNLRLIDDCNVPGNKVILYYRDSSSKKLIFSDFTIKTIRKR